MQALMSEFKRIARLRGLCHAAMMLLLWLPWPTASLAADPIPMPGEYQVKSTLLYNFGRFVTWPGTVYSGPDAPMRICVLGTEDPFGKDLDIAIEGERVRNRTLHVLRMHDVEDTTACQIVFISRSERRRMAAHLRYLEAFPVLTVGDSDDFLTRGGMIQFFNYGNKVRFILAHDKMKAAGLQVSARLLRVAQKSQAVEVGQ